LCIFDKMGKLKYRFLIKFLILDGLSPEGIHLNLANLNVVVYQLKLIDVKDAQKLQLPKKISRICTICFR